MYIADRSGHSLAPLPAMDSGGRRLLMDLPSTAPD